MTTVNRTRTFWRMQLHPSDSANSTLLASESLSAGFIGLDFATDIGDLHVTEYNDLPDGTHIFAGFLPTVGHPGEQVRPAVAFV